MDPIDILDDGPRQQSPRTRIPRLTSFRAIFVAAPAKLVRITLKLTKLYSLFACFPVFKYTRISFEPCK